MGSYSYNLRRYLTFSKEEWLALLITAVAGGFMVSFNDWGGKAFDIFSATWGEPFVLSTGIVNFVFGFVLVFLVLAFQVLVSKMVGVRYGVDVTYDKYLLGLLVGFFVTFLSFGYLPFFITGRFRFRAIPNLRVGKFRANMAKNWEIGLSMLAGPLALILTTIPINFLMYLSGMMVLRQLLIVMVLLAVYAMLPLPLIETANLYTVYMSRLESLEGGLPGYDIYWWSKFWYFFSVGLITFFAIFTFLFQPSVLVFTLSTILGIGVVFLVRKSPILYGD